MTRIEDLMQDAAQFNATELLLCSSQKPRMKVGKSWRVMNEPMIQPLQLREQIFQLIPEEKKNLFFEENFLQLSILLNQQRREVVISQGGNGMNLHIRWFHQIENLTDFAIPQSVFEVLRRGEGLSLITGSRSSGKSTLARQILEKVSQDKSAALAFVSDEAILEGPLETGVDFISFTSEMLIRNIHLLRGFDFIVVDSLKSAAWKQAIQLAEIGARVLLLLPYADIQIALLRLAEKLEGDAQLGLSRVVHILQVALSLKLATGIDQRVQPVFELVYATQEIKKAMLEQNWPVIAEFIRTQGEKTGMRTMNQSLLSLMLKRKIDIKAGFLVSPAPEELDRMLEKAGI